MWRPRGVDRTTGLFVSLVVASLILVTFDIRASGEGFGGTLRDFAQAVFTPVQKVATAVIRPVVDFFEGASDLVGVRDENRRLRGEVDELQRRLQETEGMQARLEALEEIHGLEPPEDFETVTARVLALGPSEFDEIRVLDKGRSHGITEGLPVVDEGGLIGRVASTTDTSARVRLITDPTVRVGVRVERTGETGWVTGRGSGPLTLEMFNTEAALLEGDLLVTADGRFPPGIAVATVTRAARAEVGFALRTNAEPTVQFTRIDFVAVIVCPECDVSLPDLEEPPVEGPAAETSS